MTTEDLEHTEDENRRLSDSINDAIYQRNQQGHSAF